MVQWMGRNYDVFPGFQKICVILRYTVYVYLGNLHTLLRILTYEQTVPSFSDSGQIVFFEKPVIATFKVHIS